MNEKKSSIVGFALIGLVLLVFSWYNTKQFEKQQAERQRIDSLARLDNALKSAEALSEAIQPSFEDETSVPADNPMGLLDSLSSLEASYWTIGNDRLELTFSTKGAQISSARIKDYYTYDSLQLQMIRPEGSSFDIEFTTKDSTVNQAVNTAELGFEVADHNDSTLVMRLNFAPGSYFERIYRLSEGSNILQQDIRFVGMKDLLPRSQSKLRMTWNVVIPRLEKGYKNERQYSKVAYRLPGSADVEVITKGKDYSQKSLNSPVNWFAVSQQFFSAILIAPENFSSVNLAAKFFIEDDPSRNLMACTAVMEAPIGEKSDEITIPLEMFIGPNQYYLLKSYDSGFDKLLPLGGWLISSITKFIIIPLFNWLHKSIASFGLIILIMTLILKTVIMPLTVKSYSSSAKMRVIKPEVDKINARYPKQEDAMKRQQATMDLYRRCGISTLGGCLPMLFQFPLLWAMFRFFPASIELRQQSFLWADDLSAFDSILDFGFRIPLLGDHLSLFALLSAVTTFIYSRISYQQTDTSAMPGMKFMTVWFMPIFMFFICNNLSAGLCYYYFISNLLTILIMWIIRKWFVDEKKLLAAMQAKASKTSAAPKKKKSAWQERIEAAYKEQQRMANKR